MAELRLEPPAGVDHGRDHFLADARLSELLQDSFVHDIVHAGAVELAECNGVVHVVALQLDDVLRAEDAPALEFVDEFGGDAGGADGGELFLGLRRTSGEEKRGCEGGCEGRLHECMVALLPRLRK
jgi:hypothetical protein